LADFLLDFPGYLFPDTLAFQVGIVRQLPHLFLNLAFHFVDLACDLILSTWLHLRASSERFAFQHAAKRARDRAPDISRSASLSKRQRFAIPSHLETKKVLVPAPTVVSPTPAAEQKHNEENDQ
jgi:hypothetical protein